MFKYTFEKFKSDSIKIFGDIFTFFEETFVNRKTKTKIRCEKGHEYYRSPHNHLKSCGCSICATKINSTEDFIRLSKEIHFDKFDYEFVTFVTTNTKVHLVCNDCGEHIYQTPSNNLMGKGCYNCGRRKPISKEMFLERATKFHNGFYIYDNLNYVDVETKVTIVCPIHGKFEQVPRDHMRHGCPKCGRDKVETACRFTKEEFIESAIKVHGDLYCYDKVVYTNTDTKVIIICKKHGEFLMKPYKHVLNKQKCPKCQGKHKTTEDFVAACKLVHDNFYTYDKTVYVSDQTKVIVTCPKHGDFLITPNNHLRGKRCRLCKESNGEKAIRIFLRDHGIKFDPQYRIPECRNINPLPFDFAVFNDDGSINFLLEFQGFQHYKIALFGGVSKEKALQNLQDTQKRDAIKKEYCEKNNIDILYITYKELNKISEILSKKLNIQVTEEN